MAVMIVNAFKLQLGQKGKTFVDEEEILAIFLGYEDGTFRLHGIRNEAVTILVRVLGIELNKETGCQESLRLF